MRTATDTVPYWPQPGDERYNLDGTQSGQALTLQSLAARSWMKDSLWSPDSDAFVLRKKDNQLTLPEVYTQAILYWINERFMTIGDDLTQLDADRLQIYAWLYPALGPGVRTVGSDDCCRPNVFLYEIEGQRDQLLVLVNWAEAAREVSGPPANRDCHVVDTLSGEYLGRLDRGATYSTWLGPHSCQIVRCTGAAFHPQVIGTSLHIAGGMAEIQAEIWNDTEGILSVEFKGEGSHRGKVVVYIPDGYRLAASELGIKDRVLPIPFRLEHQQVSHLSFCFNKME